MKKKVTINLSEEAITAIQRIASEERRSVSAMIEELIWRVQDVSLYNKGYNEALQVLADNDILVDKVKNLNKYKK